MEGIPLPQYGGHATELEQVPGAVWLQQPCLHGLHPAHTMRSPCSTAHQWLVPSTKAEQLAVPHIHE